MPNEEPATVFVDAIRRLYAYDAEATGRILDTAAKLSAEQFVARVVDGQRSVRDTLVHMMDTARSLLVDRREHIAR